MVTNISALAQLSDCELLARIRDAARDERMATAHLIAVLMEVDTRRLYLGEGCSSLFTYCTQVLHFSEHAAYNRIETARAARRFPVILELIESAAVTLTAVRLLAPHLTDENHCDVLERARHKSKREVELLVAALGPRVDVPSTVRKLPTAVKPDVPSSPVPQVAHSEITEALDTAPFIPPVRPAEIKPLTPERYKIQFTVSRETYEQLRRAQDLMKHTLPSGDPAIIFERGLALLVEDLQRRRCGKAGRPRPAREPRTGSRHIPAAVKRTVWQRDAGRCAFSGVHGRCTETAFLEYHHVVPFADGGQSTPCNLELRCRAHNQYEAELWFGGATTPPAREARASHRT